MKTDEQQKSLRIVFMTSATPDKQKSLHLITLIMQQPIQ